MLANRDSMSSVQSLQWSSSFTQASRSPASTGPSPLLGVEAELTNEQHSRSSSAPANESNSHHLLTRDVFIDEDAPYQPSPLQPTLTLNRNLSVVNTTQRAVSAHRLNEDGTNWLSMDQYSARRSVESRIGLGQSLSPQSAISGRSLSGSPSDREDSARPPQRPILPEFNRSLYPGYDDLGNRRGLEHLQTHSPPQPSGTHYPSRAFNYPPPTYGSRSTLSPQSSNPARKTSNTPISPYASLDDGQVNLSEINPALPALDGFSDDLNNPMSVPMGPTQSVHFTSPFSPQGLQSSVPSPGSAISQPLMPMQNGHTNATSHESSSQDTDSAIAEDDLSNVHASLGIPPDVPISLSSLRDPEPGKKPDYPYPVLMKLAIYESPRKALTLQEIYDAFERRFEWFRLNQGWKGTIRHTLSLLSVFQKRAKPITEPGKGQYWYLDFKKEQESRNKRVRKRNKKPSKKQMESTDPFQNMIIHPMSDIRVEQDFSDADEMIDPVLQEESRSARKHNSANNRGTMDDANGEAQRVPTLTFGLPDGSVYDGSTPSSGSGIMTSNNSFRYHHSMTHSQPNTLQTSGPFSSGISPFSHSAALPYIDPNQQSPKNATSTVNSFTETPTENSLHFGQTTFRINPLAPTFTSSPRAATRSSSSPFSNYTTERVSLSSSAIENNQTSSTWDRNRPAHLPQPKPGTVIIRDGGLVRARRLRSDKD